LATPTIGKRAGWVTFAGAVCLLAGGYNALSGIGAITDDNGIVSQAHEVLYGISFSAWGWFWLIAGCVQILAGVLVLQRNTWGLALAVSIAGISATMTIFVIFVVPLWAITVLTLDTLVIYGLMVRRDDFDD
jgi:hypothetical protein